MATRARRLLESEIAHGTTLMRSHVEVDPIVGYAALDGVLPLREEYAWAVTLQICVFAQEGITNQPGQIDMMREALRRSQPPLQNVIYEFVFNFSRFLIFARSPPLVQGLRCRR